MNDDLIKRYVYDVTRRLSESERDEVARELTANIADMLPENADETAVRAVLTEMGDPALLAGQYRNKPHSLISPAVFDTYLRVIGLVLPIAGGVLLIIGLIMGFLDGVEKAAADIVSDMISNGISMGIEGALMALFWITLGFYVYERTDGGKRAWTPDDLPRAVPRGRHTISRTDAIVELAITAALTLLGVLICLGRVPFAFSLTKAGISDMSLFAPDFLSACLPFVIALGALDAVTAVIKLVQRRWCLPVCVSCVVNAAARVAAVLYALTRPQILSGEFIALLNAPLNAQGARIAAGVLFMILIALACAYAVVRTARARQGERAHG